MPRKVSYVALGILHIVLLGISSCFIQPVDRMFSVKKPQDKKVSKHPQEDEAFLKNSVAIKRGII